MPVSSTWSLLFLGNFAEMDTDESDAAAEVFTVLGTHGSAGSPLWQDKIDAGVEDASDTFDSDNAMGPGTITYDVGTGGQVGQIDHMAFYNGTVRFTDGSEVSSNRFMVFQTDTGDVFLAAYPVGAGPDLYSKAVESITLTSADMDGIGGLSISAFDTYSFVCFATGTHIGTPCGLRAVENLRPGDLVSTMDHGAQPLIWRGARGLRFPGAPEGQKPIEIKPGSLGRGLPRRTLVVSPQHRVLLEGPDVVRCTGQRQAFGPAKGLTPRVGVRRMTGRRAVTYHALLFARHEVIYAEGQPVESFYPSAYALGLLPAGQRFDVLRRLPCLFDTGAYGPPARPLLTRRATEALVSGRGAEAGPPVAA